MTLDTAHSSLRAVLPHAALFTISAVILTVGLWPFHAPLNQVSWLPSGPGLRFGEYADIATEQSFPLVTQVQERTLEIQLQALVLNDSNTFLSFYRPNSPVRFELRQLGTAVNIEQDTLISNQYRQASTLLPRAFARSKPVLLTVVANSGGTTAYVDDQWRKKAPSLVLDSRAFAGRLLIGNSPFHNDSWSGVLSGLAMYDRALSEQEIGRDFESWTKRGSPVNTNPGLTALYLFDEKHGDTIQSKVPGAPDLRIPRRYFVFNEVVLEPFWREFSRTWGYWKDMLINVSGFIPLGFAVRAYWERQSSKIGIGLMSIGIGLLLSLTIELLQGFLPTRASSTTDVLNNTLGTGVGVLLYRWAPDKIRGWLCSRAQESKQLQHLRSASKDRSGHMYENGVSKNQ